MAILSGSPGSCWVAAATATNYPPLEGSIHADAVVVGAGIVGLTKALGLCEANRSVIVVEGLRTGGQVTGRSTAKITTQHGHHQWNGRRHDDRGFDLRSAEPMAKAL